MQDYALAVAEFEMADAKAQREAAEAATLRKKAEQLEGQAIELAEKWTGQLKFNSMSRDCTASAGQRLPVWSSTAVYTDSATSLCKHSHSCFRLSDHLTLCAAAFCCAASTEHSPPSTVFGFGQQSPTAAIGEAQGKPPLPTAHPDWAATHSPTGQLSTH